MDNKKIIEMLRKDMRGEHQAVIQYLAHAYAMGEGEIPSDIEEIARDEMRHFDWLADKIVELGGDPDMTRKEPDLSLEPHPRQMQKDVALEQEAIDLYREHMEAIEDPALRRLLARIIHDEMAHQKKFRDFADELSGEDTVDAEAINRASQRLAEMMNYGVRHEYTVILQYLYHSFVADDEELKEEMENSAINEMQHMGWIAEELQEKGQQPDYSHEEPFLSRDHVANLKADIEVEEEVTRAYSNFIPEVEEEDIREILERARDNEIYHADLFRDLLDEAKERQAGEKTSASDATEETLGPPDEGAPDVPSIGSLLDK